MPTPPPRPAPPTLSPLVVALATGIGRHTTAGCSCVTAAAAAWTPGRAASTTTSTTAAATATATTITGLWVPAAIDASEARFAASTSSLELPSGTFVASAVLSTSLPPSPAAAPEVPQLSRCSAVRLLTTFTGSPIGIDRRIVEDFIRPSGGNALHSRRCRDVVHALQL